ncbi:MAG: hypothetical protein KDB23_04950, partial [Planctomycetales bacterium]|nr:hypothetical protein [Planctomycetales bacterium]
CYIASPAAAATPGEDDSILLHRMSAIHFLNAAEAQPLLAAEDTFTRATTDVDRQLRLHAGKPVDMQTYLAFVAKQTLDWQPAEIAKITAAIDRLRPRLRPLRDLWPQRIPLIKTTGLEEINAPHCRGNAIVLPKSALIGDEGDIDRLLLHELFHILSRQSVELSSQCYEIIGYQRSSRPIELPAELAARKLTNPDAPLIDVVIRLDRPKSEPRYATPVLLSRQSSYDSTANTTVFQELQFFLLVVEQLDGVWVVSHPEMPGLINSHDEPSFRRQVGNNTKYIIHPEEILADNFIHVVLETPSLPDPWIVDALRSALSERAIER